MEIKSPMLSAGNRADAGVSTEMDCVLITSAADMADVLRLACPAGAFDFARVRHERACYDQDDERMGFWLATMDGLARPGMCAS